MPTLQELQQNRSYNPMAPKTLNELRGSYQTSETEGVGFKQRLAQGVASPFLKLAGGAIDVVSGLKGLATGDTEAVRKATYGEAKDFGYLGKVKPLGAEGRMKDNVLEGIAVGLELSSYLPFGRALGATATVLKTGLVKSGIARGAFEGAVGGSLTGAGVGLQQEGRTKGSVIGSTITGGVLGGVGGGILGGAGGLIGKLLRSPQARANDAIDDAINKGIKPYFSGVKSANQRNLYMDKAKDAFRIIHRLKPEISDEFGEKSVRNPTNRVEMLEAIKQAKNKIYQSYHHLAIQAGDEGAKFDVAPIIKDLYETSTNLKLSPQIRQYASNVAEEIAELQNAAPEIIEARIQEYNSSLASYYAGRIDKGRARVDASVASLMRERLDNLIESETGHAGYQLLKNQYSSLKTIEKDIARQVAVELRRNQKGLIDFTDIFTGADLVEGIITANPTAVIRGGTGRILKELYKKLNDPNRYIKRAFDVMDDEGGLYNTLRQEAGFVGRNIRREIAQNLRDQLDNLKQYARTPAELAEIEEATKYLVNARGETMSVPTTRALKNAEELITLYAEREIVPVPPAKPITPILKEIPKRDIGPVLNLRKKTRLGEKPVPIRGDAGRFNGSRSSNPKEVESPVK